MKSCVEDVSDVGITVPGAESNQQFVWGENFATESQSHVLVFHLVGQVKGKHVSRPVTVETKQTCISCGRQNKSNTKFCAECGTSLRIFA
jgi:rRNA maturation endonuclease Nob1